MKTIPRKGKAAFTLIELLAVITIIVILAGLVVGGLNYVSDKQASSQAKVQMALISKALEEFKQDYGFYPPGVIDEPNSPSIPPKKIIAPKDNVDPVESQKNAKDQSADLYMTLFGDLNSDGISDTDKKNYLPDLDPAATKQGWIKKDSTSGPIYIVDPWGNPYAYRSAKQADGSAFAATQNPDFDLWSYGKDGKSTATLGDKENRDDIKNP